MTIRRSIWALAALGVLSLPQLTCAEEDEAPPDAVRLQQSGEIMSRDDLLERVHEQFPGKVVEAKLQRRGGRYIYDVVLLTAKDVRQQVQFDARTGKRVARAEESVDEAR